MRDNRWYGLAFPKNDFTGEPALLGYQPQIPELNLDWGWGSPAEGIPSDYFSTLFQRYINTDAGTYELNVQANDGVRVYIDGKLVLDEWNNVSHGSWSKSINLSKGKHRILLKHHEISGVANLKVELTKPNRKKVNYVYENYNITFNQALDIQMTKSPQTDKYKSTKAYIHKDYVQITRSGAIIGNGVRLRTSPKLVADNIAYTVNSGTRVTILEEVTGDVHNNSNKWYKINYQNSTLYVHSSLVNPNAIVATTTANVNVREAPSTNSHVYETLSKGTSVNIIKEGNPWHEISYTKTWRNAKREDVAYYLNPNNFARNSKEFYQFLSLSTPANINPTEVNNKILYNKGVFKEKASAFAQAAKQHNINEIYLIAHALLETGNGSSQLAKGVYVTTVDGKPVTPRTVYNVYGIGAYDSCPLKCGAEYAYNAGWFSVEQAIIGGAKFIGESYIHKGQDTLYKIRWNPANPGNHQYATDIGWAVKQTSRIYDIYSALDNYSITFKIPVYK